MGANYRPCLPGKIHYFRGGGFGPSDLSAKCIRCDNTRAELLTKAPEPGKKSVKGWPSRTVYKAMKDRGFWH